MGEIGEVGDMAIGFEPSAGFDLGGIFGVLDLRAGDGTEVANVEGRSFGVSEPFVRLLALDSFGKIR